jgi:hypothetical protein
MPDNNILQLRATDQARTDFALIESNLEFMMGQLARVLPPKVYAPPRAEVSDAHC